MKTETELRAAFPGALRMIHTARGALRLLRPQAIDRDVAAHVDGLAQTEAIMRLLRSRAERERMTREIRIETEAARRAAGAVALYPLHGVAQHVAEWRAWVQAKRRDVGESFPSALLGVTRDGMIMMGLAREQVRARLLNAAPGELLRTYSNAWPRQNDPIALLETEIIESMLESNSGHAANDVDLPTLKKLRALVADLQALRLPADLPDFEALQADVDRLQARASTIQIVAVNPEHDGAASAHFKAQEAELLSAGTRSDADDIAIVRAESGAAVGE